MKFTTEEISLCKQIAEKHRKPTKHGDWYISYDGGIKLKALHQKGYRNEECTLLWQIHDCLEFFEKRDYQVEIKRVSDSWLIEIWKIGHKAESIKEWTPKLRKTCLNAVLTVLEEGKNE